MNDQAKAAHKADPADEKRVELTVTGKGQVWRSTRSMLFPASGQAARSLSRQVKK